jgi:hypothetical protein
LHLIARLSLVLQELAAHALTGIAAGGCKEKIRELGGIELLVRVLKSNRSESSQLERVKAHAANALAELARDDAPIQREVVQCGGIDALVAVVTTSKLDSSKARAAGALWSMSSTSHQAVVAAGSIESYVLLDGLLMASRWPLDCLLIASGWLSMAGSCHSRAVASSMGGKKPLEP